MRCQSADINPEAGFFEMGMDSLMVVELKDALEQQLGCTLEATLIFDHPNLKALAKYLVEEVIGKAGNVTGTELKQPESLAITGGPVVARQPGPGMGHETVDSTIYKDLSEIEGLSDDEVARLIDEELKDI
jgi:acyl carrier protein